jgi:hypothetical protein
MGFEHEGEARRFLADLRQRMEKFALALHPDKTRLIEFGRYAAERRTRRGLGKPETFNFLGFTHIAGRSRQGALTGVCPENASFSCGAPGKMPHGTNE